MRHHLFIISLLLTSLAFIVAGCKDKGTEPEETVPSIPIVTLKGPNTNSTDAHPTYVKANVARANSFSSLFTAFLAMQGVQTDNVWTWTYAYSSLNMNLTATRRGDGSFAWKMIWNGTDASDGTVYNNWTAMEGTTSGDGKNGSWKLYQENTPILVAEYIWTTGDNVLTVTLKDYKDDALYGQTVIVNNPDSTGELRYYDVTKLIYKATWQANGSGQWWMYDSNGNQNGTGTWTQ